MLQRYTLTALQVIQFLPFMCQSCLGCISTLLRLHLFLELISQAHINNYFPEQGFPPTHSFLFLSSYFMSWYDYGVMNWKFYVSLLIDDTSCTSKWPGFRVEWQCYDGISKRALIWIWIFCLLDLGIGTVVSISV